MPENKRQCLQPELEPALLNLVLRPITMRPPRFQKPAIKGIYLFIYYPYSFYIYHVSVIFNGVNNKVTTTTKVKRGKIPSDTLEVKYREENFSQANLYNYLPFLTKHSTRLLIKGPSFQATTSQKKIVRQLLIHLTTPLIWCQKFPTQVDLVKCHVIKNVSCFSYIL